MTKSIAIRVCTVLTVIGLIATALPLAGARGASASSASARDIQLRVIVCAAENATLTPALAPSVAAIRAELESTLATVTSPSLAPERIASELHSRYANSVTAFPAQFRYLWQWDTAENRWVLVCKNTLKFEIELATKVMVLIEIERTLN